jgi:hypothetical protein
VGTTTNVTVALLTAGLGGEVPLELVARAADGTETRHAITDETTVAATYGTAERWRYTKALSMAPSQPGRTTLYLRAERLSAFAPSTARTELASRTAEAPAQQRNEVLALLDADERIAMASYVEGSDSVTVELTDGTVAALLIGTPGTRSDPALVGNRSALPAGAFESESAPTDELTTIGAILQSSTCTSFAPQVPRWHAPIRLHVQPLRRRGRPDPRRHLRCLAGNVHAGLRRLTAP